MIPGFNWNNLGVALYGNPLAQWAEYFGVTALAFIPAVFSIWLWRVCRRAGTMVMHEGRRSVPWDFFMLVAVLLGMFVIGVQWTARYAPLSDVSTGKGGFHHSRHDCPVKPEPEGKVGCGQQGKHLPGIAGNDGAGDAGTPGKSAGTVRREGTETSLEMPAWVIWPESSFPISTFYRDSTGERFPGQDNVNFLSAEEEYVQAIRDRVCNFILLTGTDDIYLSDEGRVARAYNCLTVFEGDYSTAIPFAKSILVPFGEYIPMRETFPFLEKAFEASAGTAMGMNYTPGTSSNPVPVPIRPGSSVTVGVIPLVCFEDVVGSWVRRFVRPEPQVLVNVTNDGWFNRSWANEQHWRNAAFPVH